MGSTLQNEIRQSVPFKSLREELWLNLSRTAAEIGHVIEQSLRPYGLSPTQYNVLRILRGAGPEGLCQYEIKDRLVAQVPDVPRILERMEKAGWVQRVRAEVDKRMVMATLSEQGRKLVDDLDAPLPGMMDGLFRGLNEEEQARLNELLVVARKKCDGKTQA
jgi:MarR family transcriptional regulator, 2-MHQ and catechol-resistance regulon repressor